MFKTILLPIDLTSPELARPAVAAAAAMAKDSGTTVHLLHVMTSLSPAVTEFMPPEFEAEEVRSSSEALRIIAREAGLAPGQFTVSVRKGGVYHEIIETALERGADLIVMSSHKPATRTYFIGSNAASVVRYATCSVLVVRE